MKGKQRVFAFIDSQNLNLGVKQDIVKGNNKVYEGWKLDFRKFFVYLKDKFNVETAFLFIGRRDGEEKLYSFSKEWVIE